MHWILELNEVPAVRRHIYVYAVLLLVMVLTATLQTRPGAGTSGTDKRELGTEVTRLVQIGAIAKDLY